jgi:hypothetical protein
VRLFFLFRPTSGRVKGIWSFLRRGHVGKDLVLESWLWHEA